MIMVVEDEHLIEEHLEDLGCAHASFHDAPEAMSFFRDN